MNCRWSLHSWNLPVCAQKADAVSWTSNDAEASILRWVSSLSKTIKDSKHLIQRPSRSLFSVSSICVMWFTAKSSHSLFSCANQCMPLCAHNHYDWASFRNKFNTYGEPPASNLNSRLEFPIPRSIGLSRFNPSYLKCRSVQEPGQYSHCHKRANFEFYHQVLTHEELTSTSKRLN